MKLCNPNEINTCIITYIYVGCFFLIVGFFCIIASASAMSVEMGEFSHIFCELQLTMSISYHYWSFTHNQPSRHV